ncbi:rhamnogalacturonan acetylesterase, partial [Streptomyces sp. NPDC057062]|uniref:rhamnogalacturonan acetylesterase n=1 Tax=Streptomyces sp. NPDC057062 TaxID=3346011 RepID=UPI003628A5CD
MSLSRRHVVVGGVGAVVSLGGTAHAGTRRARTVWIAGDSTAAQKYAPAAPETGWGTALPFLLGRGLAVANHAVIGRSSKSFVDEGRLDALLAGVRPGDLLIVQFAHNDEMPDDPSRYTEPWTTYQRYLRLYLDGARARGARPVLATPVERRRFDADGRAVPSHGEYPEAMRALARQERIRRVEGPARWRARGAGLGPGGSPGVWALSPTPD